MVKNIPAKAQLCRGLKIKKTVVDKEAEYAKGFSDICNKHGIDPIVMVEVARELELAL